MQTCSRLVKVLGIIVLISMTMPAFAESAPVYDADSMPQFENVDPGNADQGQDYPPPPAPGQEGAFVPSQSPANHSGPPTASMSMDQRMRRVEQQINNMQDSESAARVDSLQNQIQSLRGQLEQLTHQLQQVQDQQKNMYSDLEKRLSQKSISADTSTSEETVKPARKTKRLAAAKATATTEAASSQTAADTTTTKSPDDQPNVAEEQQIYQTAYNLIKAKKYSDAVAALQSMLKKYPSGQFASNAHYWLGELYGVMQKNDQALVEFSSVVSDYPSSPRVSDAQLKVGLIYASQFKWPDAKAAFKKVINHYPGTASARLAAEQLKQIKQAGH